MHTHTHTSIRRKVFVNYFKAETFQISLIIIIIIIIVVICYWILYVVISLFKFFVKCFFVNVLLFDIYLWYRNVSTSRRVKIMKVTDKFHSMLFCSIYFCTKCNFSGESMHRWKCITDKEGATHFRMPTQSPRKF